MSEIVKEGLKLLIPRYYKSEEDLIEESFRIIIRNKPKIRIELALELYKNKKASLAKSAEIAGLTTIEFKEVLADRGIKREIEGDEIEEIDKTIKEVFGSNHGLSEGMTYLDKYSYPLLCQMRSELLLATGLLKY